MHSNVTMLPDDKVVTVDKAEATTIETRKLAPLVDFILQEKAGEPYFSTSDDLLDPLVYHEFDLQQSLATMLQYAFHPDIPSHVLALSSIRCSYWKEVDGRPQPFPEDIAKRLTDLDAPLALHLRRDGLEPLRRQQRSETTPPRRSRRECAFKQISFRPLNRRPRSSSPIRRWIHPTPRSRRGSRSRRTSP